MENHDNYEKTITVKVPKYEVFLRYETFGALHERGYWTLIETADGDPTYSAGSSDRQGIEAICNGCILPVDNESMYDVETIIVIDNNNN